jgi:hypothetical protein
MATTTARGGGLIANSVSHVRPYARPAVRGDFRPRRITPEAGRAIEMLGHAIEYLGDEFALECRARGVLETGKHPCVSAIELLMARSREIYFSSPVVPTLGERLWAFLRPRRVSAR